MPERDMNLMKHAVKLADFFTCLKEINTVCLTGSLARWHESAKANDIDLVLLHNGQMPDIQFSLEREKSFASVYSISGELAGGNILLVLFGDRAKPIIRYISREVDGKVDVICVSESVLISCGYLNEISQLNKDPDFFKRIFCELPLRAYSPGDGHFWHIIHHNSGKCCLPHRSWEVVKREVKQ